MVPHLVRMTILNASGSSHLIGPIRYTRRMIQGSGGGFIFFPEQRWETVTRDGRGDNSELQGTLSVPFGSGIEKARFSMLS